PRNARMRLKNWTPSPLMGEGWDGSGSVNRLSPPTPTPPHKGGRENIEFSAVSTTRRYPSRPGSGLSFFAAACLIAILLSPLATWVRADEAPLSPAEAATRFVIHQDLALDQVLAEPVVRQPVFLNFDERGRMWVVQYIQYPHPAGLNMLS